MVLAMDEAVGRIVEALKSSGHYNNTIIIFSTDNGAPTSSAGNNWPLRGRKGTLWEGGTRGPAFVHSPLLSRKGVVSNELIHVTDWFPTIAGLGGGAAPEDTHGYDQWASISTGAPSPRVEMVYNIDTTNGNLEAGIRMGYYKLLIGDPGNGDWTPPPEGLNATQAQGNDSHQKKEEEEEEGSPHDGRTTEKDVPREESSRIRRSPKEPLLIKMGVDVFGGAGMEAPEEPEVEAFNKGMDAYTPDVLWQDADNSVTLGELNFDLSQFRILENFVSNDTEVRLFHVMGDPDERINVAEDQPDVVQILMNILQLHMKDYVEADIPPEDPAGAPRHWNNTWSPGWCEAK
ncbi:arylsulfatase B-like [Palaemon carinicauda]|uniref:arylsulfatase B-like n=1 Tax=Palaemon carinicauda TaxID=392227 RepID=UPI0035B6A9F5